MSNGAIATPPTFGWKDHDWVELLACMRRRKVIPVIGEELLQVEIDGKTVPLYTWMAKRLASELDVPAGDLPSLNDVACRYLARSDSNRNSVYMRLWIIMDEAKANLRPPMPLRQLAEITDFNLFLTTTFDSLMESALNEIRKKEIESLTYSPTDRQDLRAEKDLLPPTVYHIFGTLDVSPTYAVSREDLLEWIYAMQSQLRPKNLFDELRQNYLLILGAHFPTGSRGSSGCASRNGSPKAATGLNTSQTAKWLKMPTSSFCATSANRPNATKAAR